MTEYYERSFYDIIPIMENSPGDPYYTVGDMIICASSQWVSPYPPYQVFNTWKAFNGSVDDPVNCWVATTAACWIRMYIGFLDGRYYDVSSYTLTSGPVGTELDATPRNWTLKGSNDGENWTVLDTRTDELNWDYSEQRVYTIATPGDYTWYQFDVTHNNYSFSGTCVGEFNLRGSYARMSIPSGVAMLIIGSSIAGVSMTLSPKELREGVYATLSATIDGVNTNRKIMISSFNCRKENGNTKYISAVVPSIKDGDAIADMSIGGSLTLFQIIGGSVNELGTLPVSSIRYDEGGKSQSITIQANA